MNASRVHPAWVVIVAGVSVALHIGKLPPALPVLREALDISLLQAGFLLSLVQLAGMALGLAIGLGTDALGLRRSMLLGMGILCGPARWAASRKTRTACWFCAPLRAWVFCWGPCPLLACCGSWWRHKT